jgi:hypothetical protein
MSETLPVYALPSGTGQLPHSALLEWPGLTAEQIAVYVQIARELGFCLNTLPPTLTPRQTAVVLDVSEGTLEQWRGSAYAGLHPNGPVLPYQKTGRSIRYPVWEVAKFIRLHTFVRSGLRLEEVAA